MRSKKVSNYNLYRIGRQFGLAGKMTSLIFDPTVNWMPTGFVTGSDDRESDSDNLLSGDELEIGSLLDAKFKVRCLTIARLRR